METSKAEENVRMQMIIKYRMERKKLLKRTRDLLMLYSRQA